MVPKDACGGRVCEREQGEALLIRRVVAEELNLQAFQVMGLVLGDEIEG